LLKDLMRRHLVVELLCDDTWTLEFNVKAPEQNDHSVKTPEQNDHSVKAP
jgi:hypothetical protein